MMKWFKFRHVRVYEYLNNSWVQLGQDIDGNLAMIIVVMLFL